MNILRLQKYYPLRDLRDYHHINMTYQSIFLCIPLENFRKQAMLGAHNQTYKPSAGLIHNSTISKYLSFNSEKSKAMSTLREQTVPTQPIRTLLIVDLMKANNQWH